MRTLQLGHLTDAEQVIIEFPCDRQSRWRQTAGEAIKPQTLRLSGTARAGVCVQRHGREHQQAVVRAGKHVTSASMDRSGSALAFSGAAQAGQSLPGKRRWPAMRFSEYSSRGGPGVAPAPQSRRGKTKPRPLRYWCEYQALRS